MTICEQLEKILGKKHVSIDEAISVILSVKGTEEAITDMVLAIDPKWRSTTKKADEQE